MTTSTGSPTLLLLLLAGAVIGVVARVVLLPALVVVLPRRAEPAEDDADALDHHDPVPFDVLGGPHRPAREPRALPGWLRSAPTPAALVAVVLLGLLAAPPLADLLGLPPRVLPAVGVTGLLLLAIATLRRGRSSAQDPGPSPDPSPAPGPREAAVAGVLLLPLATPLLGSAVADSEALTGRGSVIAALVVTVGIALGAVVATASWVRRRAPRRPVAVPAVLAIVAVLAAGGLTVPGPAVEVGGTSGTTPAAPPTPDPDAPEPPPDQDAPGQTYELVQDNGELTPFADRTNRALDRCTPSSDELQRCGRAPALQVAGPWFNLRGNPAPTLESLRGRVVLLDFTASACLACRYDRTHLAHWAADYAAAGLTVIAVHRPEYPVEADPAVPAALVRRERIDYPLVSDPDGRLFDAYRNRYWPAKYLIDATGTVRAIRFGAGGYATVERQIRTLLQDARPGVRLPRQVDLIDLATPARTDGTPTLRTRPGQSGYHGSPDYLSKQASRYAVDISQPANTYSLGGVWDVADDAVTAGRDAALRLHYHAAEVWQMLGGTGTVTVTIGEEVQRTIRLDGVPRLYRLTPAGASDDAVLTASYSSGITSYGFSFG